MTPYRGAGRQHGVFVIERLLDIAAHELGIDRAEIRRRNLIPADAFPYNNEIIYQDFAPLDYDSGNYEPVLDKALDADRLRRIPRRGAAAAARRRDATSASASSATSKAPASGRTRAPRCRCRRTARSALRPASARRGRGISPSFAQIVADQLGVDVTDVDVVTGDTDQFYWGAGTFASRGAVVAGNAVNEAAQAVRQKILKLAAEHFECAEDDLEIADGEVSVVGVPGQAIKLGDAGAQGQSDARRGAAGHRAGAGIDAIFRPAERHDRERRARHDRRSRPGDV